MLDPRIALGNRQACQPQRIGDVLAHAHMRVERIVLEHHGTTAIGRLDIVHDRAADGDAARGDVLKPGDHAQKSRLAAARWPDDDNEMPVGNGEIDAV